MTLPAPLRRWIKRMALTGPGQMILRSVRLPFRVRSRLPLRGTFEVRAPTGERFTYVARVEDALAFQFIPGGLDRWERSTVDFLTKEFRAASTFWDIGAYSGVYSLLACAVNPNIEVVAFEPVPLHAEMLRRNIEANGWENRVRVVEAAVTDLPSPVEFKVASDDRTASGIDVGRPGDVIMVPTVRLSDFTPAPDVIKIDVEGSEIAALSTGLEMIRLARPTIVAECLNRLALAELLDFVGLLDYTVRDLDASGAIVTEAFDLPGPYANFVAIASAGTERRWS